VPNIQEWLGVFQGKGEVKRACFAIADSERFNRIGR
jgi:hypothetical protein